MAKEVCFRCNGDLVITDEYDTITFYKCDECKRAYAKSVGKSLTDKWLNPISIALYRIIFETEIVSDEFIAQSVISLAHLDVEQIKLMVEEIEEELNYPKQKLVDVLDLKGTEKIARDYLFRFSAELKRRLLK